MEPADGNSQQRSWQDAKAACVAAGGALATIDDKGLDNFLGQAAGGFAAWIGLNDLKKKGKWVWDEGLRDPIPWDPAKSYNGFKGGAPDGSKGDCVTYTSLGWVVDDCSKKYSYICSKHAFNLNYDPGSNREGHLPRGLWSVSFDVYADDALPCGVRVDAQSGLQVYRRYASNPYLDDGPGQATYNSSNNYQIVHVDSTQDQFNERSTLEYAHYYPSNTPDLATVGRMTPRESCAYEYVSSALTASQFAYQVAYTGFDAYGYAYQRIIPTVSFDNTVSCSNGEVKAPTENRCVCPPGWTGAECSEPLCMYGTLAPNDITCRCLDGYTGDFCETPTCLRGTGMEPPPITNVNKTFGLIIDGSFTGYNNLFLTNFKKTLDKTLGDLQAIEGMWFKNYLGVITYDKAHVGGPTSDLFNERGRADFEKDITDALAENYKANGTERSFMRSLLKIVNSPNLEIGSPIYIITDSAIADPGSFSANLYNLIAQKHVTISTIILGDKKVPGGKNDYRDPKVEPFITLAFNTGGGFYQVEDYSYLSAMWTPQLASYFSSVGIAHNLYRRCSDRTDYFQVGGSDTNVIIDIWSPYPQNITLVDPDENKVAVTGNVQSSNTNFLFTLTATKPGIWRAHINHTNKTGFCAVAVRAVRPNAPNIGFNNDIGMDRGLHSQGAGYAPTGGLNANSIIAYSSVDYLRYVHVYTHDTGALVFTSPLIKRVNDCKWNYASKFLFTCPASSFTVAVEGSDPNGHQFRRLYSTHCTNYDKSSGGVSQDFTEVVLDSDIMVKVVGVSKPLST